MNNGTKWLALLFAVCVGDAKAALDDMAEDMVVNAAGEIFVTGFADSENFPTTAGAFQTKNAGGSDAFAAKLSGDGARLLYSTYIGGKSSDLANGIAVDAEGNAYVAGRTSSSNFPSTNGTFLLTSPDAFLTKLSADGSRAIYSTYLPGDGWDEAHDVAVDSRGTAWVVGETGSKSVWVTTPNAFRTTPCARFPSPQDAFVVRLSAAGPSPQLLLSTLLCGNDADEARGVAIDAKDNVYVVGYTFSKTMFPIKEPLQSTTGEAFLSKINGTSFQ